MLISTELLACVNESKQTAIAALVIHTGLVVHTVVTRPDVSLVCDPSMLSVVTHCVQCVLAQVASVSQVDRLHAADLCKALSRHAAFAEK